MQHEETMGRSGLRKLGVVLLGVLIGWGGVAFLMWSFQDNLLFPATREIDRDPSFYDWAFENLMLPVGNEQSHAWWVPLDNHRGVALFSHGNAGNIAGRLESIGLLRSLGFSVLAYDYGGYGRSTGRPSEARLYADIRAAWKHLIEDRSFGPEEIILFGRSLGAAPSIDLATEVEPAAVIVESAFISVPEVAGEVFWWLPTRWLVRHKLDNGARIGRVKSPILVIHSPDDTLIRYRHGQTLFELAPEPKTFLEIRGDHNEGFVQSMDVYKAGWEAFLAPLLPWDQASGGSSSSE